MGGWFFAGSRENQGVEPGQDVCGGVCQDDDLFDREVSAAHIKHDPNQAYKDRSKSKGDTRKRNSSVHDHPLKQDRSESVPKG